MNWKPVVGCILAVAFCGGCTTVGNIGILAKTGADPMKMLGSGEYKELGPATASACRVLWLGMFPGGDATAAKAMERALANSKADALVNVTVKTSLYNWFPIYSLAIVTCTTVQGTAVKFVK